MNRREVRPNQECFNQQNPAVQHREDERHGTQYSGLNQGVDDSVMHVSVENDPVGVESISKEGRLLEQPQAVSPDLSPAGQDGDADYILGRFGIGIWIGRVINYGGGVGARRVSG